MQFMTQCVAAMVGGSLILGLCTGASGQRAGDAPMPHEDLFRLAIPDALPPHPRVFCTQADLDRIKEDIAAGDIYSQVCLDTILANADQVMLHDLPTAETPLDTAIARQAESLAQAYALTGEEKYGRRALAILRVFADVCPTRKTTSAAGRFTDSTLMEGPLAVAVSMAYDLIAGGDFVGDEDRRHIEEDLLRVLAWESGHGCRHMNSSNWRSWGLCILASCGFAIGDRELIDEAINGAWDPKRNAYLYGIVQQLTHSVFSDGIHWERSIGYTYYTGSAMMYVMEAAKNSGINLWQAELPGILGPFVGHAGHEEYGPAGPRSIKSFLDAPFYYAFTGGKLAKVGDSGTAEINYHPMYELAWEEYRDPKYAWLINRQRSSGGGGLAGWNFWRASGAPEGEALASGGRDGSTGFRMKTRAGDRIALTQDIRCPADKPVQFGGHVRALGMDGGSAHIRANWGREAQFSGVVTRVGDWVEVSGVAQPVDGAREGDTRSIRLHVFLEGGAGEVVWDDIYARVDGSKVNLVRNAALGGTAPDGRGSDFWSLLQSPPEVPAGQYDLSQDATIGLTGRHENGQTLFPVGGFAVLREDATDERSASVNFTFGPYGSGHDHPDRLHFDLFGLGEILAPDAGSWGYNNPMHVTWANQSIAHNTLTVDEVAQEPQGESKSVFAGERGEQRVFGVLRKFIPDGPMKAVRATCDTAYPGVSMDRALCLVDGYIVDVFRARSDGEHVFDLALNGLGTVEATPSLASVGENPFRGTGYLHLEEIRGGIVAGDVLGVTFTDGPRLLNVWQVSPEGAEAFVAKAPARSGQRSILISRRRGTEATYVTVMDPHSGNGKVTGVSMKPVQSAVEVTVVAGDQSAVLRFADDPDGDLRLVRP